MRMMDSEKTIAAALERGAEGLSLRCERCYNQKNFTAAQARARWPQETRVRELGKRARCLKCGRQGAQAKPLWKLRSRGGSPPERWPPKDWGNF